MTECFGSFRVPRDPTPIAVGVTIMAWRQPVLKRVTVVLVGMLVATDLPAATPSPYPNEVNGLRFYKRYLAPLHPLQSDTKRVVEVLGSDQGLDLEDWRIRVLYSCTEDVVSCSHGPRNDPLDTIVITPKHRVSLRRIKLPSMFSHAYGGVSEINVTCDIYSDDFGLEYWVLSDDFQSYRKGDLLMIRYGLSRAAKRGIPPRTEPK